MQLIKASRVTMDFSMSVGINFSCSLPMIRKYIENGVCQ